MAITTVEFPIRSEDDLKKLVGKRNVAVFVGETLYIYNEVIESFEAGSPSKEYIGSLRVKIKGNDFTPAFFQSSNARAIIVR